MMVGADKIGLASNDPEFLNGEFVIALFALWVYFH